MLDFQKRANGDESGAITPRRLKDAIARRSAQFAGSQQQVQLASNSPRALLEPSSKLR